MNINFGERINERAFENILKDYYRSSLRANNEHVNFNLSYVEWCEPFSLSLLTIWISELVSKNIKVKLFLPSDSLSMGNATTQAEDDYRLKRRVSVFSFFKQQRFLDFLISKSIIDRAEVDNRVSTRSEKNIHQSISPILEFNTALNFEEFMTNLDKQYSLIFKSALKCGVVETGQIKNVILNELGNNIFEHGKGKFAHMQMVIRDTVNDYSYYPVFERSFLKSLDGMSYLILIIVDKGPGIKSTLSTSYLKNNENVERRNINEHDIMRWSFGKYNTSKSLEERVGALAQFLKLNHEEQVSINSSNQEIMPRIPSTGLYNVMRTLMRFNGFLLMRSGKSILCLDYLTYPRTGFGEKPITNLLDPHFRHLVNFGGVQLKLYFPLALDTNNHTLQKPLPQISALLDQRDYKYLKIGKIPDISNGDFSAMATWVLSQIHIIERIKSLSKTNTVIILDGTEICLEHKLSHKTLYYFIVEVLNIQSDRFICVFYDPLNNRNSIRDDIVEYVEDNKESLYSLLVLDKRFDAYIFGLSSKFDIHTGDLTNRLMEPHISKYDYLDKKVGLLGHVMAINIPSNVWQLNISIHKMTLLYRTILESSLKVIINNDSNYIIHTGKCYLIHDKAYCNTYFELNRLLINKDWQTTLCLWVYLTLKQFEPISLVCLGKFACSLGKYISNTFRPIKVLYIPDSRVGREGIKVAMMPKDENIVLFTSMIGTQDTLNTFLDHCGDANIRAIVTIVDGRNNNNQMDIFHWGKIIPLFKLLMIPIQYWKQFPHEYEFNDIIRIDPDTDSPIIDDQRGELIWKGIDRQIGKNFFLYEVLRNTGLVIGHLNTINRHLTYAFSTNRIADFFGAEIASTIKANVNSILERDLDLHSPNISHIIYPAYTHGIDKIVGWLNTLFENSSTIALTTTTNNRLASNLSHLSPTDTIIFIDDAISTGDTIDQVLEIGENSGAGALIIYILCNRMPKYKMPKYKKLDRYGRLRVHLIFLSEFDVPTFTETTCPICEYIRELHILRHDLFHIKDIRIYLDDEIRRNISHSISVTFSADTNVLFFKLPVEYAILRGEIRSRLENAQHNYIDRKMLIQYIKSSIDDKIIMSALFDVFALEEYYWKHLLDSNNLLFYEEFINYLISLCDYYLDKYQELNEYDLINLIRTLKIFDRLKIYNFLSKYEIDDNNKLIAVKLLAHLLIGFDYLTEANNLLALLKKWDLASEDLTFRNIADHIERKLTPTNGLDFYKSYRRLQISLSAHSKLSVAMMPIDNNSIGDWTPVEFRQWLKTKWPFLRLELLEVIIPNLKRIQGTGVGHALKNEFDDVIASINAAINKTDQLKISDEINDTIKIEIESTLNELYRIALLEGDNTIYDVMNILTSDAIEVIPNVISSFENSFKKLGITLYLDLPQESIKILIPIASIQLIINNIFENIRLRAFRGIDDTRDKKALIKLAPISKDHIVLLEIYDNGIGVSPNIVYGPGLHAVNNICTNCCYDWNIEPCDNPIYNTRVYVKIFRIEEDL
jgi:hypothetical protein